MASVPFFFAGGAYSGVDPYPAIVSADLWTINADATSHIITLPTVAAGDLILVMWANDDQGVVSATGFTEKFQNHPSQISSAVFAKIAIGDEGGTTVDFVTSVAERWGAIVYRINNWGGSIADNIAVSSPASSGTTGSPDCPSLTSGFGAVPTLWFAVCAASGNGQISGYPEGYAYDPASNYYAGFGGSAANALVSSVWKHGTAASENPGVFTFTANTAYSALTVAVS